jgi:hypothetical protein
MQKCFIISLAPIIRPNGRILAFTMDRPCIPDIINSGASRSELRRDSTTPPVHHIYLIRPRIFSLGNCRPLHSNVSTNLGKPEGGICRTTDTNDVWPKLMHLHRAFSGLMYCKRKFINYLLYIISFILRPTIIPTITQSMSNLKRFVISSFKDTRTLLQELLLFGPLELFPKVLQGPPYSESEIF